MVLSEQLRAQLPHQGNGGNRGKESQRELGSMFFLLILLLVLPSHAALKDELASARADGIRIALACCIALRTDSHLNSALHLFLTLVPEKPICNRQTYYGEYR